MTERKKDCHIIFDSMGLKVHGEGEWKVKVHDKGGICIVPPPSNAAYKGTAELGWEKERDDAIAAIHEFGGDDVGRRLWKMCSGYYERSLAETAMFRIKRMLGERLKARSIECQETEAICRCMIVNKMNKLGMPRFE